MKDRLRVSALLVSLTAACSGFAVAQPAESPARWETADAMHESGASMLFGLTDDIDSFFGDVRTEEHKRNDWFRIGAEIKAKAASPLRLRERVRADLDLKEYARNLRFFISGDNGDRFDNHRTIDDTNDGTDFVADYRGNTASSGISYDFYRSPFSLVSADIGLKFGGAHPFGQLRASRWIPLSERLSFEPTQYFQWIEADGFGEKTRGDLNYALTETSRLRARTEALWSESSRGVDLLEDLSWLKKFTDRTYAGVAASVTAFTDPSWTPDVYKLALRYRQLIYEDWLYMEAEPGLEFPEERDYKTIPYIAFRFDAYFERPNHPIDR